jgi:hypothetical protein
MNYINKEDRNNIKSLNKILGMQHRSDPYDFKKPKDIIQATELATAEYLDMTYYWMTLSNIDELFDESLEHFNTAGWINIGLKGTTGSKKIDSACSSLEKTAGLFHDLMMESEENCAEMWNVVLFGAADEVRQHFFGENINYPEEVIKTALERTFELSTEIEYGYVIEKSAESFVKALKNNLEIANKTSMNR